MKLFEHHHLDVERDGDTVILNQADHSGNEDLIVLHISQIRFVAEVAGLLPASSVSSPADDAPDPDAMDGISVESLDDGITIVSQSRLRGMGGSDDFIELHPIQAKWLALKLLSNTQDIEEVCDKEGAVDIPAGQLDLLSME